MDPHVFAIDFINQYCRSQRGEDIHYFTFTNYTLQHPMKNRSNHEFEHVPEKVGNNWPEGDGVKIRTSIFVNVDVTA
jgi:hypothetical protein